MKIVVDSNVVFSAILNTGSNIGQIILVGSKYFDFLSINFLKSEITRHKEKIKQISGYGDEKYFNTYELITSKIQFFNEVLLSDHSITTAFDYTKDIDVDDTLFVALTEHCNAKLWTGDKKLLSGLRNKGYENTITTAELYEKFIQEELKSKN